MKRWRIHGHDMKSGDVADFAMLEAVNEDEARAKVNSAGIVVDSIECVGATPKLAAKVAAGVAAVGSTPMRFRVVGVEAGGTGVRVLDLDAPSAEDARRLAADEGVIAGSVRMPPKHERLLPPGERPYLVPGELGMTVHRITTTAQIQIAVAVGFGVVIGVALLLLCVDFLRTIGRGATP